MFFDSSYAPLVAQWADPLKTVKRFVGMTDRMHMPEINLPNLLYYEDLIGVQSEQYEWPEFNERSASSLCYTSGTTGNPKSVLYSHRSTGLHSLMECAADTFGVSSSMWPLLAVPMFQGNAWDMTETSPIEVIGRLLLKRVGLSQHDRTSAKMKAGRAVWDRTEDRQ